MRKFNTVQEAVSFLHRPAKEPKELRNAFSTKRRVTVEDVFHQSGKRLKGTGEWRDGSVIVMMGGHGTRILPPRKPIPEPLYHHKEMLWAIFVPRKGYTITSLVCVRKALEMRELAKNFSVHFKFGKHDTWACGIRTDSSGRMFWVENNNTKY